MKYFNCDYNEGAYPPILKRMSDTNMCQSIGYSEDEYCEEARNIIRGLCNAPDAAVHFLVGGTQANLTVISAALRSHQGVISAATGHISVHETGAIEATGHKVLAVNTDDGLLTAEMVEKVCHDHFVDEAFEHMVQPGMVYISSPSELGTIYSRKGLSDLRAVCDKYGLLLYLDGARLGYGMADRANDIDLPFLYKVCDKYGLLLYLDGARLGYGMADRSNDIDLPFLYNVCDVFYIGGTKQGALMGEAVVIRNEALKKDFRYMIKQRGGMFAKGRLLGIQFLELFRDGAYFKLAEHADRLADDIRKAFADKGYSFLVQSGTNQIFVIVPNEAMEKLNKKYVSSNNGPYDENHTVLRFCTSWATNPADVQELIEDIKAL
ncbi:MAG: aminotransferase class I/II-fold pyridoxal phosphate-dependent enzyme [Clostridia bacterium]|nr:aminotransferase class I/II-fold pyridoxal phosphate-dependent enzyme [Clostridia bacterium]